MKQASGPQAERAGLGGRTRATGRISASGRSPLTTRNDSPASTRAAKEGEEVALDILHADGTHTVIVTGISWPNKSRLCLDGPVFDATGLAWEAK